MQKLQSVYLWPEGVSGDRPQAIIPISKKPLYALSLQLQLQKHDVEIV